MPVPPFMGRSKNPYCCFPLPNHANAKRSSLLHSRPAERRLDEGNNARSRSLPSTQWLRYGKVRLAKPAEIVKFILDVGNNA
jgi:hypothetical protein